MSLPISPWNCARSDTLTTLYRDRLGGYLVSTRRWDSNRKKQEFQRQSWFFSGVLGICFNQQKMGWMIFGWKTMGFFPCLPQGPFPCLYPARHDGRGLHGRHHLNPETESKKTLVIWDRMGPSSWAKLVQITIIAIVYDTQIIIFRWGFLNQQT